MKLLPKQPRVNANPSGEPLGLGIEAAVILTLFFFAGFGLDRLFSTTPVFMIVLTLIGSIGLFAKYKYRYDDRMEHLEAERAAASAARRGRPAVGTADLLPGPDHRGGQR